MIDVEFKVGDTSFEFKGFISDVTVGHAIVREAVLQVIVERGDEVVLDCVAVPNLDKVIIKEDRPRVFEESIIECLSMRLAENTRKDKFVKEFLKAISKETLRKMIWRSMEALTTDDLTPAFVWRELSGGRFIVVMYSKGRLTSATAGWKDNHVFFRTPAGEWEFKVIRNGDVFMVEPMEKEPWTEELSRVLRVRGEKFNVRAFAMSAARAYLRF